MNHIKKMALDITEKLVTARLTTSTSHVNRESGEHVGEYFNAIYNAVLPIVEQVKEEN